LALGENAPAVSLGHALHNGQAQPGAFGLAGPTAVETIEDVGQILRADTWAIVLYPKAYCAITLLGANLYMASGRREFHGVIQKIAQGGLEAGAIAI
jgi:hypothetical protein